MYCNIYLLFLFLQLEKDTKKWLKYYGKMEPIWIIKIYGDTHHYQLLVNIYLPTFIFQLPNLMKQFALQFHSWEIRFFCLKKWQWQNINISFLFCFGFLSAVFHFKDVVQFLLDKGANTKLGTNSKSYFGEGKTACYWNARVDYIIPGCSGCSDPGDCDSCHLGCSVGLKFVVGSPDSNEGYFIDHKICRSENTS